MMGALADNTTDYHICIFGM